MKVKNKKVKSSRIFFENLADTFVGEGLKFEIRFVSNLIHICRAKIVDRAHKGGRKEQNTFICLVIS